MEAQTVPPCETHAPVSSALKDPHDAIAHTETRRHGGHPSHRTQAPCLYYALGCRDSV